MHNHRFLRPELPIMLEAHLFRFDRHPQPVLPVQHLPQQPLLLQVEGREQVSFPTVMGRMMMRSRRLIAVLLATLLYHTNRALTSQ